MAAVLTQMMNYLLSMEESKMWETEYISSEHWAEFEERFPDAVAFLNYASLDGEYYHLYWLVSACRESLWQRERYEELRKFRINTGQEL